MKSSSRHYASRLWVGGVAALALLAIATLPASATAPLKAKISPKPPRGAVVLFNGRDTSHWTGDGGRSFPWKVVDGAIEIVPGSGSLISIPKFEDFQLHLEFIIPLMPNEHGQARGNSGVYLQGRTELQVLDSWNNETYANGSCGAIYLQYVPRVNASKPPEQWQSYDVFYTAGRFNADGSVKNRPMATIYQNGILIHDNVEIHGTPDSGAANETLSGPLLLQDHHCKVKYRNIWMKPGAPKLPKVK